MISFLWFWVNKYISCAGLFVKIRWMKQRWMQKPWNGSPEVDPGDGMMGCYRFPITWLILIGGKPVRCPKRCACHRPASALFFSQYSSEVEWIICQLICGWLLGISAERCEDKTCELKLGFRLDQHRPYRWGGGDKGCSASVIHLDIFKIVM